MARRRRDAFDQMCRVAERAVPRSDAVVRVLQQCSETVRCRVEEQSGKYCTGDE